MTRTLDDIDPGFVDRLINSRPALVAAQEYFNMIGRLVIMPPTFVRPNSDERAEYTDDGDLWVAQKWEIKGRMNIDFTDASDYPYPDVYVDSVNTFRKKRPPPSFYMILNRAKTRALVIDVMRTKLLWGTTRKFVPSQGLEVSFYTCPLDKVIPIVLR